MLVLSVYMAASEIDLYTSPRLGIVLKATGDWMSLVKLNAKHYTNSRSLLKCREDGVSNAPNDSGENCQSTER